MATKVIINLPDHVYRRVASIARQSQRPVDAVVADVVARSVRAFPVATGREDMLREIEAFRSMHATLQREHPGEYVAIHGGRVVDHDPDPVTLLRRVRHDYPGQTVLRRKVEDAAEIVLCCRSAAFNATTANKNLLRY
jgi:predicted transcriptional regulator